MKLNPMSPKIAAVILLATTGATLSVTPAQAAEEIQSPVIQTDDKYDLASFKTPVFEAPKVVSWAVAYAPNLAKSELDPAEKALLADGANLAQKQKVITEETAAIQRVEVQKAAEAKAAAEKAEAEKIAAAKAAAEKVAAEAAAAKKAEEVRQAAEAAAQAAAEQAAIQAQQVRVAAAAAQAPTAQWNTATGTYQTVYPASSSPVATATTPALAAPVASSAIGAALVASAYGQIGTNQDCTAMVEKALRSVGKNVGDLAPLDFYRYGTVVTNPQPGDLMIRPGHVAIYVGNGMAISGGFNGGHTELHPASYLAGSTFVRVS